MNYADAARIKAVLGNCGFSYTPEITKADIVIFHTCSVRQKSEDKITGKLKSLGKHQKIRITGCMIQHGLRNKKLSWAKAKAGKTGNFLWSITSKNPEVVWVTSDEINNLVTDHSSLITINHVFNPMFYNLQKTYKNLELLRRIDDTGFLPLILKKLWYKIKNTEKIWNEYEKIIPENEVTSMNTHKKTAYVPISTGCNQFCSYCIVPYARGFEKHFPLEHILKETKTHLKNWASEIVLLGQIVNKHPQFLEILKEILKLKGLHWLRYTSPYPSFYTPELIKLHETQPKLCPHIHIPFQSGSDKILKAMHRGYTVKQAKNFIDQIQKLKRKISITTDIIVGFPGETDADFKQTLNLVKYGNFDMIYIGIYSPRPGTKAAKELPDTVSKEKKRERRNTLNELLKKTSEKNNQKEVWTTREMMINEIKTNEYHGYTDNMKQITISKENIHKVWDIIQIKITKWIKFKLYGEEIIN